MSPLRLALAALASLTVTGAALGQDAAKTYPARAIRVVVPFPPGGTSDILQETGYKPM